MNQIANKMCVGCRVTDVETTLVRCGPDDSWRCAGCRPRLVRTISVGDWISRPLKELTHDR